MEVKIKEETIKVGQFLKLIGIVPTGGAVKNFLLNNVVEVNSQKVTSRNSNIHKDSVISINGELYKLSRVDENKSI